MAPMTAQHALTITPDGIDAATVALQFGTFCATDEAYRPTPDYRRGFTD